jgi:hypothetical protein
MAEPEHHEPFDPSQYLSKVGGGDYLEVKWRLVWLRDRHPNASIETELVSHDMEGGFDAKGNRVPLAIFKAKIALPFDNFEGTSGGGIATGWGTETLTDFKDYIEKAETKAIGRALAALGFGTQFCPDHDFGAAQGRVVDTPVDLGQRRDARNQGTGQRGGSDKPASPAQIRFIESLQRDVGEDAPIPEGMTSREASARIEVLQRQRNARPKA